MVAERKIIIGKKYRDITGRVYRVNGIARDTETKKQVVVYQEQDGDYNLWTMPMEVFNRLVDKSKYPNTKQNYVFDDVKK